MQSFSILEFWKQNDQKLFHSCLSIKKNIFFLLRNIQKVSDFLHQALFSCWDPVAEMQTELKAGRRNELYVINFWICSYKGLSKRIKGNIIYDSLYFDENRERKW